MGEDDEGRGGREGEVRRCMLDFLFFSFFALILGGGIWRGEDRRKEGLTLN